MLHTGYNKDKQMALINSCTVSLIRLRALRPLFNRIFPGIS